MLWIAGHVVQTRAMLLKMLGDPVETRTTSDDGLRPQGALWYPALVG
jgi:hypothetical protein